MNRSFTFALTISVSTIIASCAVNAPSPMDDSASERVQIIFDTDFGGDADDLGALAMLHHYADLGEIELLAVASWSNEQYAIPALAAVNQYYGRPSLRLGVREVHPWQTEWNYSKSIADQFLFDRAIVDRVEPAVALYRTVLEDAEPQSVTIVTVGPLANIQNLLRSNPDEISSLSGAQLVSAKVDRFVIMGGQFPVGVTSNGPEWNFDGNMKGVTREVLEAIDRPIVFSGYEVGEALKYGSELNDHASNTPLYVGYKYFSEHAPWMKADYQGQILDNSSFDQTAVMYAAIGGEGEYWVLSDPGKLSVDDRGVGTWSSDPAGKHTYLILSEQTEVTVSQIEKAMTH